MAAYVVIDVGPVRDEARYADYRGQVPAEIDRAGGTYLVRGGPIEVLEGGWMPQRLVIVRFDSAAEARRWWSSPDYATLKQLRQQSTDARMVLVEGVSEVVP